MVAETAGTLGRKHGAYRIFYQFRTGWESKTRSLSNVLCSGFYRSTIFAVGIRLLTESLAFR